MLIGYDGSDAAIAAAALFPGAEATIATVQSPPPTVEAAAMARVALPDALIREGIERMRAEAADRSQATVVEGVARAQAAGLRAGSTVLVATSAWRALRDAAARLGGRAVLTAHAWRSPVRHTLRGHALLGSLTE